MLFATTIVQTRFMDLPEFNVSVGRQLVEAIVQKWIEEDRDDEHLPMILLAGRPNKYEKNITLGDFFADLPDTEE